MSNVFDDINPDELNWGTDAKQAAIGGLQADPERSAEAMRLSKTTGAPAVAIEQDPEPFKLQTRTQALGQIFSDNLEMQKYATSNPQAPKVSNDDWDKLDIFSKWMKTLKTSVPAALAQSAQEETDAIGKEQAESLARQEDITSQFSAGGLQYERGALGTAIGARNELGLQIEPTVEDRINEIEKNLQGAGSAKTIFGQVANMVGTMLPSVGPTFAGAAVGSVVGTPGFGTGAGAITAFGTDQGRIIAGNAYLDGMKMNLDPTANLLQSVARGVVGGALNAIGGAEGGKPLVAGIERVMKDGAERILSNATWVSMFSRAAQSTAKQGLLGAAIMGAQTYADEIFSGLAKEFTAAKSGKEWATIFNDPEERARMTDVVTDAMMQGAEFFALMHIPAIGINMHVDAMHIAQSKTNAKMLDGILRARDETKTWTRSPELIDEFVRQHELGEIGLDPNVALQIAKDQPQAFRFVPDFERKAIEAQQSGGLLAINANDYIARVGPELHGQIKDDLSINGGLTVNEARVLEEAPPNYTTSIRSAAITAEEHAAGLEALKNEKPDGTVFVEGNLAQQIARQADINTTAENAGYVKASDLREFLDTEGKKLRQDEVDNEIKRHQAAWDAYQETSTQLHLVADAEARGAGLDGLFADAKAAGMTKAEYALYQRKLADAQKAQDDKVFKAAAREAKKRLSEEWKKNEERVRGEVEPEIALTPEFMAIRAMVDGKAPDGGEVPKVRLDAAAVKEMLGDHAGNRPDYPDTLPKGITEKEGIHPDDAAGIFGFDSGQEMLARLGAAETDRLERNESWKQRFDRTVDEETSRRMEAQYGKLEENIVAEAREAALNAAQINVLSAELEHLAKLSGIETPFAQAELRASAAEIFDRRIVGKESKPDQWVKNAGRMARQAEMMLLRGKYPEAYMAKQRQMLALNIAREAQAFATQKKNFDKIIQPFLKNETLAKVDQGYTDQIQRVLNQVLQYPTRRDMAELIRGNGKSLTEFVEEKQSANRQIDPPEYLFDQQFLAQQDRRPETLTVGEFRDLRQFMKQMIFHGKDEKEATVNGQKVVMEQARADAIKSAGELRQAFNTNPKTAKGAVYKALKVYDAAYLKADRLLSWLGGRDPNSPWMQIVVRPLQEAKHRASDLSKEMADAFRSIPRAERTKDAVADSPFRDSLGNVIHADRETLLMAMLNVGNDGNLKVLARGYHTTPDAVMNWIHNNATEKDWRWVQGLWDIFDERLFPLQDAAARENTGVGIKKVEAREIETAHGTFRGGYFPLMEDFTSIDKMRDVKNPFDNPNGFPPVPTANWMKRRTGAAYPVSLELGMIPSKINDIIHYVSYSKAWKDANNFLDNPGIKNSIDKAFGQEYRSSLQAWMNHVATNGGRFQRTGLEGFAKGIRFLRENMVGALIGLKPGTAVIHGGAALFNSIAEVGFKPLMKAVADQVFRSPENFDKWSTFALEKSGELRNRKMYIDRDLSTAMQESLTDGKFMRARAAYLHFVTGLVGHLDQASAIPTWIAAYQHYMKEFDGKFDDAEGRATFAADQAVRQAHGANGLVDLSAIMRTTGTEGEMIKFFTAFGGFFNHYYNQLRDAGRAAPESIDQLRKGNYSEANVMAMKVMGGLVGYLLAGSLWHSFVRKHDDEDFFSGKHIASAVTDQLLATQFGIRDAAFWWRTGHKGSVAVASPMGEILTGLLKPAADLDAYAHNKMPKSWVANALQAPMFATGIGAPKNLANMIQYLTNAANGRARAPGNYWEWHRLMLDSVAPATSKRKRH